MVFLKFIRILLVLVIVWLLARLVLQGGRGRRRADRLGRDPRGRKFVQSTVLEPEDSADEKRDE
jgi:flagellar biogenesis protein FliO